ncbi:serine/arginine-rich splicing factor 10-like isoform X2 [Coregonus clupeaformis]|uniref:serine/arginine-rich splicing factor 10-like isoform X2 n=1 Tax=Coregonus clupeaformis TaxID=59861 RepID=UPI001BE07DCD|nr:serine/arginine-rich splicing factor 10-like isoform X2 [Coregonus clupeaformis]
MKASICLPKRNILKDVLGEDKPEISSSSAKQLKSVKSQAEDQRSSMFKGDKLNVFTFEDVRDAEDALHNLDRKWVCGRQIEIQFAQGDRKTPNQMKTKESSPRRGSRSSSFSRYDDYERGDGRRRRSRSRSYERRRSRSPSCDRRPRRSESPRDSRSYGRHRRSRSHENDRYRGPPREHNRMHHAPLSRNRSASHSPSPPRSRPKDAKSQSKSPNPVKDFHPSSGTQKQACGRSYSRSLSRSRSHSRS